MTKLTEKVRDIVEVRPYTPIDDFQKQPDETFVNYHFTDITAFMMGRWIDGVVARRPEQSVRAVAGFRGVGKSHFLSTFSVILSHPEVRARITDSHVLSSSQQLLRRHYPVVNVRRGTRDTLLQEFSSAVSTAFDLALADVPDQIDELVSLITERAGGLPSILIIDSSPDRAAPISRNDGDVLSAIADACRVNGMFVGLALDDDIAGADGSNAAVSKSFAIEYLDQEHLHKVVNANIFPKNPRTQSVLGRLYSDFRAKIPDFRWSEQRFNHLYPLHPATLELAPFIRSYLPRFTFLGFASSAGERILSRPADSLIGIEEVFDTVERELRKITDLNNAFHAFDKAAALASSDFPVASRYQAKLVLKALMLNSLARRAVTPSEIAGSLMIVSDELRDSTQEIGSTLNAFAAAAPEAITVDRTVEGQPRYLLNIRTDKFIEALKKGVEMVPESAIEDLFRRQLGERFSEFQAAFDVGYAEFDTTWRGSLRPGRVILGSDPPADTGRHDWEVVVRLPKDRARSLRIHPDRPSIEWRVDDLTVDERTAFCTAAALISDATLHAEHPDQFSASLASASSTMSSAIERVMVRDAGLVIDGFDYNFSEAAQQAKDVSGMLGIMLEPIFEAVYAEHPFFVETLTPEIVQRYVHCLSDGDSARTDQHALTFGVAVGLVGHSDSGFTVVSKEQLGDAPLVLGVLELLANAETQQLALADVETSFSSAPFGLSSEVIQLLLATMAFRELIAFVTSEGQQIGGRSIDLKLDWQSIKGICLPKQLGAPPEKLLEWARVISGESEIKSLNDPEDRSRVLEGLVEISAQWERRNPFSEFAQISDCAINTQIWRHASRTWDEYAAMARNVDEALLGNITLEECLERVRAGFNDRPTLFFESRASVNAVERFVRAFREKDRIEKYLSVSETTGDREVEFTRERLRALLEEVGNSPNDENLRDLGYAWDKFLRVYSAFYIELHSEVAAPVDFRQFAIDVLGWEGFQRLFSMSSPEDPSTSTKIAIRNLRRRISRLNCKLNPEGLLQTVPYCHCGLQPSMRSILAKEAVSLLGIPANPIQLTPPLSYDPPLGAGTIDIG
jgi:hypothetical protein